MQNFGRCHGELLLSHILTSQLPFSHSAFYHKPGSHQGVTKTPPRCHQDTAKVPPRHHQGASRKPPRQYRDIQSQREVPGPFSCSSVWCRGCGLRFDCIAYCSPPSASAWGSHACMVARSSTRSSTRSSVSSSASSLTALLAARLANSFTILADSSLSSWSLEKANRAQLPVCGAVEDSGAGTSRKCDWKIRRPNSWSDGRPI